MSRKFTNEAAKRFFMAFGLVELQALRTMNEARAKTVGAGWLVDKQNDWRKRRAAA